MKYDIYPVEAPIIFDRPKEAVYFNDGVIAFLFKACVKPLSITWFNFLARLEFCLSLSLTVAAD